MTGRKPRTKRKQRPADAPDWSASFDAWTPAPLVWKITPDPWQIDHDDGAENPTHPTL